MHSIMANFNLSQDVANKREIKQTAAYKVAKFYPLQPAVRMRRYGSLIEINLSGKKGEYGLEKYFVTDL